MENALVEQGKVCNEVACCLSEPTVISNV